VSRPGSHRSAPRPRTFPRDSGRPGRAGGAVRRGGVDVVPGLPDRARARVRDDHVVNSGPLTPAGLRGHVVLVDFWTLTCINWLRTEPYIRAWSQAYRRYGLIVIGVHTPEFSFEHDIDRVRLASRERGIDYPVATDNDYGSGAPSATSPGPRCTSWTPTASSATTTSAKAGTSSPSGSSSSCSASSVISSPSPGPGWKRRLTGTTSLHLPGASLCATPTGGVSGGSGRPNAPGPA
jgi:thiol-disulfide isomerase/thioredoxin